MPLITMPGTRVLKPKPVEMKTEKLEIKKKTVDTPSVQRNKGNHTKKRASSCPRCNYSNMCASRNKEGNNLTSKCNKNAKAAASYPSKSQDLPTGQRDQRMPKPQPKALYEIQSHKAYTVIAPNPKKRQDIQKKAEAELAALEDLRLSKALGYVSIPPSSVGGCLTLEEVREKQQQEMLMRRGQIKVKKFVFETSPVAMK